MNKTGIITLAAGCAAVALVAVACQDSARTPTALTRPNFSDAAPCGGSNPTPCPPSSGRITGGGRIDDQNGTMKNNFFEPGVCAGKSWATFGFNARPGKGEIQWVDHCRGLRIHGFTVDFFDPYPDPGNPNPNHPGEMGTCFQWGGQAKVNGADGFHYVTIACDRGEPGVSHDQVAMRLTDGSYGRFGVLTGGNIQVHPTH